MIWLKFTKKITLILPNKEYVDPMHFLQFADSAYSLRGHGIKLF